MFVSVGGIPGLLRDSVVLLVVGSIYVRPAINRRYSSCFSSSSSWTGHSSGIIDIILSSAMKRETVLRICQVCCSPQDIE